MNVEISLPELNDFAKTFWQHAGDAKTFALHGQMGAGKTTLVSALCRQKGVSDTVSSPTFSIINQYLYLDKGVEQKIFHIDLYRLKDEEEMMQAGVEDSITGNAVSFVEWPEKGPQLFDEHTVHIYIDVIDDEKRRVKIVWPSSRMAEQL